MYTLKTTVRSISVPELAGKYQDVDKFMAYCKMCPSYEAIWSCPPHDFDCTVYLKQFEKATVFGTQIMYSEKAMAQANSKANTDTVMAQVIQKVRSQLSDVLWQGEEIFCGSIAVFPGGCIICEPCSRTESLPCRYPDKMRYSMDSFGIDLSIVAGDLLGIELKWAKDSLPEYHTLITALLHNNDEKAVEGQLTPEFAQML